MFRIVRAFVLVLLLACQSGLAAAEGRPPEWAQPVSVQGIPNLHQITPRIYRSAQPTTEGMRHLNELGIHTVISFRHYHDDQKMLKGTGIRLVRIPIDTWDIRDEQVIATLRELRRNDDGPFLIHCQHGADRTGLMSAMYRIVVEGWDKQRAIEELTKGGYGFHPLWKNILHYIEKVDVDKIRSAVEAKA